jgi:protein-disulfide isomerase
MKFYLMSAALLGAACGGDLEARIDTLENRVAELEKRGPAAPAAVRKTVPIAVRDDDPFVGAKNAKVTLVEAFEYACPYCAILDPVMDELMKKYQGDSVKLVEKQFVVHPQLATFPALAVCAANLQGSYEKYSEALWDRSWKNEGRPTLVREALAKEALIELAAEVGLDRARFTADLDGPACKQKLERDKGDLSRAGVTGTPYLFINGRPYQGARTVEALSAAIEEAKKG